MRVKSLLVPPGIPDWYTRRRLVDAGAVTLVGRAWSGRGVPIAKVEVGSRRRVAARPSSTRRKASSPGAAGAALWNATPGEHELACRATDANGDTQPLETPWDAGGFGNNAVHRVHVTVR